jgi:hypothetical protein
MFPGLGAALQDAGNLLLSFSLTVPISQLSLVAWGALAIGGAILSRGSFNTSEQSSPSFTKMSIQ